MNIEDVTGNVAMLFVRAQRGEDNLNCERLTVTERAQLAGLMGWERTPSLSAWIADAPSEVEPDTDTFDYEGTILDRQDDEVGDYL